MEVILIQDVANLGYKNDIVKVKDGYGRNYLIPNRLAVIANNSNRKQLAEKLANTVITVAVKANEDGKIFGTVTTAQVAEALAAQGIEIDKKVITIDEAVKVLGEATATAKLHREVKAEIKLNVVAAE